MFIRKLAVLAAIAAFGLLALGSISASASTALRTDPGNALLTGSTTITNTSSSPALLTLDIGSVTCSNTRFDADVTRNSSATSITGTLTALTFTTCTDTVPFVQVTSCHRTGATFPAIHITAGDTGGQVQIVDATVVCNVASGGACYYTAATANGNASNATSTLSYTGIGVTHVTGAGDLGFLCGNGASFSVTLNHIVQGGTNRTVTITTT
jgi:hypothetical protein